MKKYISIILVVVILMLALVSCEYEISIQKKTTTTPNTTPITIPTTTKPTTTTTMTTSQEPPEDLPVDENYSVGLEFELNANGKSYSVIGIGICADTDIIIPSVFSGLPVNRIGEKAFAENATITSIKIPNTVTTIGTRAFYKCSEIVEFTIPESVISIGTQIFYGCDKLKTVYYNGSYGSADNPFLSVKNLETVVFGGVAIPSNVAYGVTTLKTVIILDSVKSIGRSAFEDCSNLTNITMSNNLTSIGVYAFWGCTALTSITIPKSLKIIGYSAFWDCTNIKDVYITDVEAWLNISFDDDDSEDHPNSYGTLHILDADGNEVTELVISNKFKSIPSYAFANCTSLTNITIPDSITRIGGSAFDGSGITNITIPDSVTKIEYSAFARCNSLSCITIPDSVTSISYSMFMGCSNLTSITIPDSITSIEPQAFYDCSKLSSITFGGTIAQWNDISKGYYWNSGTNWYVINCTDGKILRDGTVIYN